MGKPVLVLVSLLGMLLAAGWVLGGPERPRPVLAMARPDGAGQHPGLASITYRQPVQDGEVVWYLAQREATTTQVTPAISRERALAAGATVVERSVRWDARAASSVRLQVVYDQEHRQRLAWAITFPGRTEAAAPSRPGLRVLIDARTGEPLSIPS